MVDRRRRRCHSAILARCEGRPGDALIFRASDLARLFLTHNADLLGILAPQLDTELAERDASNDVRDQVKRLLRRLLASGRPELWSVARALGASTRTLRRRLGDDARARSPRPVAAAD